LDLVPDHLLRELQVIILIYTGISSADDKKRSVTVHSEFVWEWEQQNTVSFHGKTAGTVI